RVQAYFGVAGDGAVMEAANLFGLPMVPPAQRNPLNTTSRALGEAILAALDQGYTKLTIGLGGSATNDGGMGLLSALGASFSGGSGEPLPGYGRDLLALERVDVSGLDARLAQCEIT